MSVTALVSGCGLFGDDPVGGLRIDASVPLAETSHLISDPEDETVRYYTHAPLTNVRLPLAAPPATSGSSWTAVNANVAHDAGHHALRSSLSVAWVGDIGQQAGSKQRINAAPVVADGRVFTLDADSTVTAFGTDGQRLWSTSLVPREADEGEASSGGLGYGNSLLFVTSGHSTLSALEPASGSVLWTQRFEFPAIYPPIVYGDSVFLVTLNNRAWSIEVSTGRRNWSVGSTYADAAPAGEVSPAAGSGAIFFPFPSGEVITVDALTGQRIWSHFAGGRREPDATYRITGISSSPVLSGNRLYVSNQAGALTALDAGSGIPIWTVPEGSANAVLAVGDSVFAMTGTGELVRLDAASGRRLWATALPHFTRESPRRRKEIHVHYGPLLAGGRLIVASSDGELRSYDPESGEELASTSIAGGAASMPAIVNGVLYQVSKSGRLIAYR